jgi:hypothetical protein
MSSAGFILMAGGTMIDQGKLDAVVYQTARQHGARDDDSDRADAEIVLRAWLHDHVALSRYVPLIVIRYRNAICHHASPAGEATDAKPDGIPKPSVKPYIKPSKPSTDPAEPSTEPSKPYKPYTESLAAEQQSGKTRWLRSLSSRNTL